jgi:hypothetical protein
MVLLCTLQDFYNNLIVALESRTESNLDIEFVITRFLHEELKKESECSIEGGSTLVSRISKPTIKNLSIDHKSTIKEDKKKDFCNYYKNLRH